MRQGGSSIDAHTHYMNLGLTQVVVGEEGVQEHEKGMKEVEAILSSGQQCGVAVEAAEVRSSSSASKLAGISSPNSKLAGNSNQAVSDFV